MALEHIHIECAFEEARLRLEKGLPPPDRFDTPPQSEIFVEDQGKVDGVVKINDKGFDRAALAKEIGRSERQVQRYRNEVPEYLPLVKRIMTVTGQYRDLDDEEAVWQRTVRDGALRGDPKFTPIYETWRKELRELKKTEASQGDDLGDMDGRALRMEAMDDCLETLRMLLIDSQLEPGDYEGFFGMVQESIVNRGRVADSGDLRTDGETGGHGEDSGDGETG